MHANVTDRRRFLVSVAIGLAATAAGRFVQAQAAAWPAQPIRLVTGGAGGVTDIRARWLAERLATALGQPVTVDNQPAAGGNVAAALFARAVPDGHTLMLTHQGQAAVNPHLYANPGYDPLRDFAPVARFGIGALVLVVPAGSAPQSVGELVARAKANPGAMNFGSPGNGLPPHLAAVQFMRLGGFQATHIPYKGGGAMMAALLAGEVDWAIEGLTAALPQVKAGRLRALGVTGTRRTPLLPETPTLAEAGVPSYEYIGWTGVVAPATTPSAVIDRLNMEINRIAVSDEGRRWFQSTGADPGEQTPAEFAAFLKAEHARLGELVRSAGLRAE
jgi:tripartite-type tricarboxylate transporter receptor subunit TctC